MMKETKINKKMVDVFRNAQNLVPDLLVRHICIEPNTLRLILSKFIPVQIFECL